MYTHVVGTVLSVCNGDDTVWSLFGLVGSGNGGKRKGMSGRGSMDVRVTRPPPTPNTVSLRPTKESRLRIMKELNRDSSVDFIVLYRKGFCDLKHMNKITQEKDSNRKS